MANFPPRKEPAYDSGHFYSPVVDTIDLVLRHDEIWPLHSEAFGLDFNDASHLEILKEVLPAHIAGFDYPEHAPGDGEAEGFYVLNSKFSDLDCRVLYALLRAWAPRRIIEVGGGYSSLLMSDVNARFFGTALDYTCIEPYPKPFLRTGRPGLTRLVQERVETLPISTFEILEAGDVLFIDSSHVSKTGSDVNYLYLEVLPRLKPGVRIHVHDIFLPREYPRLWVLEENRSWNEQYLLRALLTHNPRYRVIFGSCYAFHRYPDLINDALDLPDGQALGGGSFWFEIYSPGERPPATGIEAEQKMNELVNPAVESGRGALSERFASAQPFRHVVIDDFFTADFCRRLVGEFPAFDEKLAINENGEVGAKAVHEKISDLGPAWREVDELVRGTEFRDLISHITGVPELKYDPYYFGGGTHENLHGQSLDAHIDFNFHPMTRQHRRLNLIVYLSEEWRTEWGGSIQLHRDPYLTPSEDEIVTITPAFNRCVIFETNEYSWHGFPRIDLPEDKRHLSRKSFALYYYTDTRPEEETGPEHSTIYVDRHLPEDFHAGMVLEAGQLQHVRNLIATRDQHLKRLYGNIKQLYTQINDLRFTLQQGEPEPTPEELLARAAEIAEAPDPAEEMEELYKVIGSLQQRVSELEGSTSWRLTAPMRAVKRFLTRQ